jgi:hypothetical protein
MRYAIGAAALPTSPNGFAPQGASFCNGSNSPSAHL